MGTGQLKYGWSYIGEDTYYSNKNGEIQIGHQTIDGYKYYFDEEGKMYKGFLPENGKVYYYGMGTGQLKYGWSIIGETVYYSNDRGEIQTGHQIIDNISYEFDSNGKLYKRQMIPIYYNQKDYRWKNIMYGIRTFGSTGCAPTSMAMAFTSIKGREILPTEIGNYLYYETQEYNRYTIGSSGLAIVYATDRYGVKRIPLKSSDELKIALARGHIVYATMGNGRYATLFWNHAIILFNYNNGNTYAYDPLKEYNNGWVSIDQLIREQSIDPDDYRGGSNFYMLA